MRSLVPFLLSLLIVSGPAAAGTEYLVITTDSMAPAFHRLTTLRSRDGLQTRVVTVEQIHAQAIAGRDVAEQIRNYIKTVYAEGTLRYVVLGGDVEQVPSRHAVYNPGFPTERVVVTDFYFSALDGDFDADGDGIFGEHRDDAPDLEPDVAIGRVPVRTATEARRYVSKLARWHPDHQEERTASTLFLAEVIFPRPWQDRYFDGSEMIAAMADVIAGAVPGAAITRLFEETASHGDARPLSLDRAIREMNSGRYGLVFHMGRGGASGLQLGPELLAPADVRRLHNAGQPFVLITAGAEASKFDGDCILEEMVRAPVGGAVATIGSSDLNYISPFADETLGLTTRLFSDEGPTVGEALLWVLRDRAADAARLEFFMLDQYTTTLLGDPAIRLRPQNALRPGGPTGPERGLTIREVGPNPFNPRVVIRFTVGPGPEQLVDAAIFDLAGRRVRRFAPRRFDAGNHELLWDGRDDTGQPASSGVYVAVIEAGTERATAKLALIR